MPIRLNIKLKGGKEMNRIECKLANSNGSRRVMIFTDNVTHIIEHGDKSTTCSVGVGASEHIDVAESYDNIISRLMQRERNEYEEETREKYPL